MMQPTTRTQGKKREISSSSCTMSGQNLFTSKSAPVKVVIEDVFYFRRLFYFRTQSQSSIVICWGSCRGSDITQVSPFSFSTSAGCGGPRTSRGSGRPKVALIWVPIRRHLGKTHLQKLSAKSRSCGACCGCASKK